MTDMAKAIYEGNKEKGFWDQPRNVGEMLMLVVTELGEALEALRKDRMSHPTVHVPEGHVIDKAMFEEFYKDTFEDEVADALIRILDMCGGLGIDIEWHVSNKVAYNKQREKLHGKKF